MDKPDPDAPMTTEATDRPNLSTEHQHEGDGRRPSDTLDREQSPPEETVPRKTSLLWNE